MTDEAIRAAVLAAGWEITPTVLYDEEGIEGHVWRSPDWEHEFCEVGDEIPDGVRKLFDKESTK